MLFSPQIQMSTAKESAQQTHFTPKTFTEETLETYLTVHLCNLAFRELTFFCSVGILLVC